jgi:hypothetical protein
MHDALKYGHNAITSLQAFYGEALRELVQDEEKLRALNARMAEQMAELAKDKQVLRATCATLEERLEATQAEVRVGVVSRLNQLKAMLITRYPQGTHQDELTLVLQLLELHGELVK